MKNNFSMCWDKFIAVYHISFAKRNERKEANYSASSAQTNTTSFLLNAFNSSDFLNKSVKRKSGGKNSFKMCDSKGLIFHIVLFPIVALWIVEK